VEVNYRVTRVWAREIGLVQGRHPTKVTMEHVKMNETSRLKEWRHSQLDTAKGQEERDRQ
jgi:hypothetical protein